MMKPKNERILEYIHKIAQKHGIDYQSAFQLKIVQEYIKYVENDDEIMGWTLYL